MSRRWLRCIAALSLIASPALAQSAVTAAQDSVLAGRYDGAITVLSRVRKGDSTWIAARRALARTLALVGRYDDAERTAREASTAPGGREVLNTLGEILMARGKRAAAESSFVRAVAAGASDSLTARLNEAIARYADGDHDGALRQFDHFIDVYNLHADQLTSAQMTDVALAVQHLGETNPDLFHDAVRAFNRAIALDGDNLDARDALGELFLDKYNSADAQTTFAEALRINPSDPRTLLDAARRHAFDGQPGVDSLLTRALAVNPNYVDALVFQAGMLADAEQYADARRVVEHALQVNPNSVRALAVAAGIRYITGDSLGFRELEQKAEAVSPHNAVFYTQVAEMVGRVRLYAAAARFAQEGVRADPRAWHAYAVLGMNQLRLGQIATGRASLDTAFKGDPYDVWTKNTLDLLDTFKNYDEIADGKFHFMIEKDESGILSIYMEPLAEKAYETFQATYDYTPPPPIRIEVYRTNADFSVRTVGMTGLGALGVSFGTTLAFDSPAAQDAGPFNWGSTMWHELAHTFTLGLSRHHVPRWLSEGLSVWEEHHGRPGWGSHVSAGFLQAFLGGRLVPVSRMNDGFMRPAYPQQVLYSYYQASLVCDLIARDWGDSALVSMLRHYAADESTEEVFRKVLHTDPKSFDTRFTTYVRQRFATQIAAISDDSSRVDTSQPTAALVKRADGAPRDFRVQLLVGMALIQRRDTNAAIPVIERARALFPEFSTDHGPYPWLAHAYEARHEYAKAVAVLRGITDNDESDYATRLELAHVLEESGDLKGAEQTLSDALYINPFEVAVHQHLAELAEKLNDHRVDVRERRAIVALGPVDRAGALYQLALAQHRAGDDTAAKRTVLRSLEQAPNYARAQELLLTLVGGGKTP